MLMVQGLRGLGFIGFRLRGAPGWIHTTASLHFPEKDVRNLQGTCNKAHVYHCGIRYPEADPCMGASEPSRGTLFCLGYNRGTPDFGEMPIQYADIGTASLSSQTATQIRMSSKSASTLLGRTLEMLSYSPIWLERIYARKVCGGKQTANLDMLHCAP